MATFPVHGTGSRFLVASGDNSTGLVPAVGISGVLTTTPGAAATAAPKVTLVALTKATLIASNTARLGVLISNNSGADAFIGFGTVDTTDTTYTFKIPSGATYEMGTCLFTGIITGYSVAGGDVMATEITT